MRSVVVLAAVGAARIATAAPAPTPIDLTHAFGTAFAVSTQVTSVDTAAEDLVDGDVSTAWSSKSGDLVGAWIAVRVLPGVSVTMLRMTVGFTKLDKARGDLFTANARIKKVRVTRDGERLYDKVLDTESRALQDLPVTGGGEFRIEVLDVVHGSNENWRETTVSELEVWGTPPTTFGPFRRTTPTITIGAFEPTPARHRDRACLLATSAMSDANHKLAEITSELVEGELRACHVDTVRKDDPIVHDHLVFLVNKSRPVSRQILNAKTRSTADGSEDGDVALSAVELGATARGLLVDITNQVNSDTIEGTTKSTLYRATASGLDELLHFDSTWSAGAASKAEQCRLELDEKREPLRDIRITCSTITKRYAGDDPRNDAPGNSHSEERVDHYRWTGMRYEKQ